MPSSSPALSHARRLALAAAVAALAIGAAAAAVHAWPHGAPNVVEGTVRTADGRGVPGATITITGAVGAGRNTVRTTTSDARGNYRLAVPLGDYAVRAAADLTFEGRTYRELPLDPVGANCLKRELSSKGITRHFVLRLTGAKLCHAGHLPDDPGGYHGGVVRVVGASSVAADARVTFTFVPVGRLADESTGKTLTFARTGAQLLRGGGTLGTTDVLHDIPLGRYRVTAELREADGRHEPLLVELDGGDRRPAARVELVFPANRMAPYGHGAVQLTIRRSGGAAPVVVDDDEPEADDVPATPARPAPAPAVVGLPVGRYTCSYRSPYAGDIPTSNAIVVVDGTRYEAYGGSGAYAFDRASETVRWTSGPLAERGVRASFGRKNGLPAITVVGGPAAGDPDGTNSCVRSGG